MDGSATITASYLGRTSSPAHVDVIDCGELTVAVDLEPAEATLSVGMWVQLTARARFGDGQPANVTGSAVWATANPDVAIAIPRTAGGVSALSIGTTEVTATYDGVTGRATVTVVAAP